MEKFSKHEIELLYLAQAIQQVNKNAILTGSLNLKLKGYKIIKECDDIDILFSVNKKFSSFDMENILNDICKKLNLELLLCEHNSYGLEMVMCYSAIKQGIHIHFMFERIVDDHIDVRVIEMDNVKYNLRLTHNILSAKIGHFFHGGSKKHLKQVIKALKQLKRGFKENKSEYGMLKTLITWKN